MAESNPFDYVDAISKGDRGFIRSHELSARQYNPFIVNRHMSYFMDSVMPANDMNERAHALHSAQYDYLVTSIRPRKRFCKWEKTPKNEDVEVLVEWYGCNRKRAEEYLSVLNNEQVEEIKGRLGKKK